MDQSQQKFHLHSHKKQVQAILLRRNEPSNSKLNERPQIKSINKQGTDDFITQIVEKSNILRKQKLKKI